MLNEVRLIGRLKDDPKIETTKHGHIRTEFVLVIDRPRYDPDLEQATLVPVFIGCVAWHAVGERVAEDYRKGDLLLLLGELEQQVIGEGPRGGQQTKTKVNVLTVTPIRLLPRPDADAWET